MKPTRVPPSRMLYLPPRNGPAGACAAPLFRSTAWSLISIVEHRTVVRGVDHERILGEALLVEFGEDAADLIVEATTASPRGPERGLAGVARMMDARDMVLVRGVIEKNGLSLFLAIKPQALSANVSPIVSSFQMAAFPPFIQPIRPTPLTSAML